MSSAGAIFGSPTDADSGGGDGAPLQGVLEFSVYFRNVAVLFLIGTCILIGAMLTFYLVSFTCRRYLRRYQDRWWTCHGFFAQLFAMSAEAPGIGRGGDSGVEGEADPSTAMTREERRAVLEKILVGEGYAAACARMAAGEASADADADGGGEGSPGVGMGGGRPDGSEAEEVVPGPGSSLRSPKNGTVPSCAICMEEYGAEDEVIVGDQCAHMFHRACLLDWLERNDGCPFCRKDVVRGGRMLRGALEAMGQGSRASSPVDVELGMEPGNAGGGP